MFYFRRFLLLFAAGVLAHTAFAQDFFQKTYHQQSELALGLAVLPNDDVILAGATSAAGSDEVALLQRVNAQGELLWAKTYFLTGSCRATDVLRMNDGNLLVTWFGIQSNGAGTGGWMKVSPAGDVLWCKQTPVGQGFPVLNRILALADGNYLLSGSWLSDNGLSTEAFLVKINDAGVRQWSNRFSENLRESLTGCFEDALGILHAVGQTLDATNDADGFYVKIGPGGALIGPVRQFDLSETDRFTQVTGTTQDRLMLAGMTLDDGFSNLWLTEIDGAGAVRWSKTYSLNGEDLEPADLLHLPGDQFLMALNDNAPGPDNPAILFKIDLSGDIVTLASRYRTNGEEDVLRRIRTTSNGFAACGWAKRNGDQDFFLAKTDLTGNIPGCCPQSVTLQIENRTPQTATFVPSEQTALNVQDVFTVGTEDATPETFIPCFVVNTDFTLSADTICPGECVEITLPDPTPGVTYTWTIAGGEPDPVQTGRVCYPVAGDFSITRTGRFGFCETQTSKPVKVTSVSDQQTPTAFSPDGDGTNERFRLIFDCPPATFLMRVYDRWGEILYEGIDAAQGWDGTVNGLPAPTDVYLWQATFDGVTAEGEVTLLR